MGIKNYLKNEHEKSFHSIPDAISGCWIHCDKANSADLSTISNILGINATDIQDSLDKHEIARVERVDEAIVIYTRHPYLQEMGLYTTTFTMVLTKDYFVTISPTSSPLIKKFLENNVHIATKKKTKLLIRLLMQITQEYTRTIKKIRADVLSQEKDVSQVETEDITDLTLNEENLNQCLTSLIPLKKVIEDIMTGKYTLMHEKDQELLEDLVLANNQAEDLCRHNLRIITSLRNSMQIVITNQFNKTIKLLTALTIILNFPTMISSLYGMNVALPFEKNPFAFLIITSFIVIVSIAAFFFFQRRKWL